MTSELRTHLQDVIRENPSISLRSMVPSFLRRVHPQPDPIPRTGCHTLIEQHSRSASESLSECRPFVIEWEQGPIALLRADMFEAADAAGSTFHDRRLTEDGAVIAAACPFWAVGPGRRFSRVGQIGDRADYYLDDDNDQVVEISGTNRTEQPLETLLSEKRKQVMRARASQRWVCVTHFPACKLMLCRVT